jgi:hypothetical protein
MYFKDAKMDEIMKELPGKAVSELMKRAGEMWRVVDPNTKSHFDQMAAQDKTRYYNEMNQYKGSATNSGKKRI